VTGIIMERLFTEGSMVRAGQPLYQIDLRSYAATASQAAGTSPRRAPRWNRCASRPNATRCWPTKAAFPARMPPTRWQLQPGAGQVMAYEGALQAAKVNLGFTRILAPISGRIGVSSVTKGALVTSSQTDALAKIQKLDPMWVNIQQSSNDYMALRRALQSGKLAPDGSAPVKVILADGTEWPVEGRLNFADVDVNSETGTVILRDRAQSQG
jgi:membrane fusion protein (multidrug efflux system)